MAERRLPVTNSYEIDEAESGQYAATITDEKEVALPGGTLSTLTLTLYAIVQAGTNTIINGRNAQDVLNTNNVTVDANGALVWTIQPADTTLVEALPFERHIALFEWTWPTGKAGKHQVILNVRNLLEVP